MLGPVDSPLQPVVTHWMNQIQNGIAAKNKRFGKDADECMKFFIGGAYDWLYQNAKGDRSFGRADGAEDLPMPSFQMSLNKASEMVQLFGPSLYHRNPVRQVTPRKFPDLPPQLFGDPSDPMVVQQYQQFAMQQEQARLIDQTRAMLLQEWQSYTPVPTDLKTESRWAIDEAIITGMGLLWPETYSPPGGGFKLSGSFYDSVLNLVIDPDATSLRDAKWIARRCCHPVWEVEREYGLPPESLRGNTESLAQTAATDAIPEGNYLRRTGQTNDLLTYWKIYSKMGMGGRLKGIANQMRGTLEQFGDYCLVVVCNECSYPLNVPPQLTETPGAEQQVQQAVQWPTPFWADDAWPFCQLAFHSVPNEPWPMAPLASAMGELKFLNWAYSFVATKIATTCRDFLAIRKDVAEEMRQRILAGKDLTLIEIEKEHGSITDVVQFLQHPQFNKDIWRVIEAVMQQFERRTGLTELMYAQSNRQLRSAAEADLKAGQLNIRPDDMANKVEDWMGNVARAEALIARWNLTAQDVAPRLGPVAAGFWAQYIQASNPADILHQLEYRIESGSTRKPNKDRDAANMADAMQYMFGPLLQVCGQVGDMRPINALVKAWGQSIDLDTESIGILFPNLPPPMPPPQGGPPQ